MYVHMHIHMYVSKIHHILCTYVVFHKNPDTAMIMNIRTHVRTYMYTQVQRILLQHQEHKRNTYASTYVYVHKCWKTYNARPRLHFWISDSQSTTVC